jgi:basic amino acid/polyamine antiporter, APA family
MRARPELAAKVGLRAACALAIADMVGVGPFLTLPLIVAAAGGPKVILLWVGGGVLALCDALVWAELAGSYPQAGGSYAYLRAIYGPRRWGRLFGFLFAAQLLVTAPLAMASGAIGLAKYLAYALPGLERVYAAPTLHANFFGAVNVPLELSGATIAAACAAALATLLVHRRVEAVGKLAQFLAAGVIVVLLVMIAAGMTHFHPGLLMQHGAPWTWQAVSAGLLLALYDYWGYYSVAFLGEEVRDARRNIPRAMLISIGVVTLLYVLMNVSVLGVLPWQEVASAKATQQLHIASTFMERLYGRRAGTAVAWLVAWTAFASIFALLASYSRVVFAAAREGDLFRGLAALDAKGKFPGRAVLLLGGLSVVFCFFQLMDVIAALVVLRLVLQFLLQAVGLIGLRRMHPEVPRPFRMWLYPLPALLAIAGFVLVLADRMALLARGSVLAAVVALAFLWQSRRTRQWPFARAQE